MTTWRRNRLSIAIDSVLSDAAACWRAGARLVLEDIGRRPTLPADVLDQQRDLLRTELEAVSSALSELRKRMGRLHATRSTRELESATAEMLSRCELLAYRLATIARADVTDGAPRAPDALPSATAICRRVIDELDRANEQVQALTLEAITRETAGRLGVSLEEARALENERWR